MIRRTTLGATAALGAVLGLGLLFAGAPPAEAAPPAHAKAHGYRRNAAQHRHHNADRSRYSRDRFRRPTYGSWYNRGRFDDRSWSWRTRSPLPRKNDLDRDGIRNKHDRDRDGDGVRNGRDSRPNNPLRR
jgi:hypothetical protein